MKFKRFFCGTLVIFLIAFGYWFFYLRNAKEKGGLKIGHEIVEKVEDFRKKNNRLPDSIAQVGIIENENTESQFKYEKLDSVHFMVWIGISFEESKFYYSDSNKWQNYLR